MDKTKISIIMPVLNEEKILQSTLDKLTLTDAEELIVVDGGSTDKSMSIASRYTDKVFRTETGRASVMNYGAQKAAGEILLFLHADCVLPDRWYDLIRTALFHNSVAAGAFRLHIDSPGFRYRIIEFGTYLRSKICSIVYGDQGIFLRKKTFDTIGGYEKIPIMEDIAISNSLKKHGKIVLLNSSIKASPRRWLNEGIFYTTLRDWSIAFSYSFLGSSPSKLIRYYREIR